MGKAATRLDNKFPLMEPSVRTVEIRNIPETPASNYMDTPTGGMNFRLENAVMLLALMEALVRL